MRVVRAGDVDLEIEVIGRGEPVVVIQTALTADELRPMSERMALGGEHQVFHYHRRGYAGSGPATGEPSIAADAADAAALIRALDVAPAHVVGASYSAAVALMLASTAPALVRTLALVELPPTGTPGTGEFREANLKLLEAHRVMGPHAALDQLMAMLAGRDWRETSETNLPGSVTAMERDADTFFTWDVPALLSWRFSETEAARVRCPVLYVGGGDSGRWFTEMRARVLRLLPGADDVTVEGGGHLVASTHPGEVAAVLHEHFRRHPRSRGV